MKADGKPRMPFLHDICKTKGSFGVSHTRVPTESRPGHIAMIAGFYEDVSAVTKGWKANPVDYDHVLARAKYAWSFGAPEIVDLFSGPNVYGQHYSSEMIDFATNDAKSLDQWSLDRLKELIEAASIDEKLASKLKSDQVVIFVHLLGLDTNGHAFKPHSKEYLENVEFVDQGIKKAVKLLEEFFEHDGRTAYIYTADHGMSDAGTHGDGDPDNTRTPLVVWGAGISGPQEVSLGLKDDHDYYSSSWKLGDYRRRDINQADLTPFMASLVGIPVPVNSEGVLPIKLLGTTPHQKSKALLDNVKQIASSYSKKEELKTSKEPFYCPHTISSEQIWNSIKQIESLISSKQYPDSQKLSFATVKECLEGLRYLHKYDSLLLKSICTMGYLGWIAYALVFLIRSYSGLNLHESKSSAIDIGFTCCFGAFSFYLLLKRSPFQYYMYSAFTAWFWHQIAQSRNSLRFMLSYPFLNARRIPAFIAYVAGLELLVLTFFQRQVLAGINVTLALVLLGRFGSKNPLLAFSWTLTCLAMSAFAFLEPIKLSNDLLYISGVFLIMAVGVLGYHTVCQARRFGFWTRLSLIGMAGYLAKNTDMLLKQKLGLPRMNQNIAWLLLTYSIVSPIIQSRRKSAQGVPLLVRLLDLFVILAPAYVLLSISYEPLFYGFFGVQLAIWISLESSTVNNVRKSFIPISPDHLWISFGFLFFVNLAFFSTGNVASISSFTLESVYRFITVFSPFSMAALLIFKLLLPFILLSAAFGVLSRQSGIPTSGLVLLVVATTDIMTLNFFFLVRDHGSWLEIGSSISHFVIASSLIVFTLLLAGLSNFLLAGAQSKSDVTSALQDSPTK